MSHHTDWKRINPPSKQMRGHYESLFKRNQMKFMRRSVLALDHLGSEFSYGGSIYKLLGTANPLEMVVEKLEDGSCYLVHCDLVTKIILDN